MTEDGREKKKREEYNREGIGRIERDGKSGIRRKGSLTANMCLSAEPLFSTFTETQMIQKPCKSLKLD